MALLFGWNAFLQGASVDWALARQGVDFVYLGADSACIEAQRHAREVKLKVGLYWSLTTEDPTEQAKRFLTTGERFTGSSLPPAVYCYKDEQLDSLKAFVEALEKETKRPTLIGGTPKSLRRAGLLFGRSNPLWIDHRPLAGGPTLPVGWKEFAVWHTINSKVKGVSGEVGYNGGQPKFVSPGIGGGTIFAGAVGVALLAGAVYYYSKER